MIYFIEAQGVGMIKIGYSAKNSDKRIVLFQTGSPVRLLKLALIDGDLEEEHRLHCHFYELWSHGEWFRDGPDLRDFIETEAEPWDRTVYVEFLLVTILRRKARIEDEARRRLEVKI